MRLHLVGLVVAMGLAPASVRAQPTGGSADPDEGGEVTEPPAAAPEPAPPPPEPEREAAAVAAPASTAEAPPAGFTWSPFGYLRVQGAVVQNDPNVAFVGRSDGFELQNARVGVRGALAERAAFLISIDGAIDERDRINDPNGRLRVGLRDAFVDLHLGAVDLRAGRFDPVFDPERLYADTERPFVDRALESRGVRPTEGWETDGLPPGRSIGLAVRRDPGTPEAGAAIGFELAAQNGADEFSSDNDNDWVAVSAAGLLRLANGTAVVAAARWNPRTEGDLPFRQDETDLEGGLGAIVAAGPVQVGVGGIVVHTIFDTTGGPGQNAYGGHAQVMVRVLGGAYPLSVGYRFAILDPSDLILTDRVMEHTAGAVVAWPALRMRGQLNVTHVMEQADRDLSNGRVEAAVEVSL